MTIKPSHTLLRFWAYVKRPVYYGSTIVVDNSIKTFWELFKVNLWSLLGLIILAVMCVLVGTLTGIKIPEDNTKNSWKEICMIIVVAPFIEELIFRGPLRYAHKTMTIAATLGFIAFYSETYRIKAFDKTSFWIIFLLGIIIIPLSIDLLKNQIKDIWITYFKRIYWVQAIVFGLVHLGNYDGSWSSFLVFWPVLCLHQTVLGFLNGYARMRYGFWYAVALHIANNSIPAIFLVIELLQN